MPANSPRQVTTTFITKITDGKFDEVEKVTHPEGPFDGSGEWLMFVSIAFTQFLLQFVLPRTPTEISDIRIVEKESLSAEVHAELRFTSLVQAEIGLELRTENCETAGCQAPGEQWRIWDVDIAV